MHLNVLDRVTVSLLGDAGVIRNYLKHEFGVFETRSAHNGSDIAIEFVNDVSSENESVRVRPPVAYDDRGVFLHDPAYHVLRIDFDAIGKRQCRVTCDRNFNPHFFGIIMEYLIHFHLLRSGAVFCHCSAFRSNGKVVVCPAWRNVGKTNVLMSFLFEGAEYIADDWAVLLSQGKVYSLPKRLNLLYYNFEEYPQLLETSSPTFSALVEFVKRAKSGEYDLNAETISVLTDQARLRLSPYEVFAQESTDDPCPIDHVFLLQRRYGQGEVIKEEINGDTLVHIMNSILEFEQQYFHLAYLTYKAQTGYVNDYLERSKEMQLKIMIDAFGHVPLCHSIAVPSQHHGPDVYQVIRDELETSSQAAPVTAAGSGTGESV